MPVGVLTNVCAVFIGTFIGGFIKKILPKHLIEELPKVFGICSVTIGITSILNVKTMYFCNKNELSTNIKSYTNTNNSKSNLQIINIIMILLQS